MTAGSSMAAMIFRRPPQCGQCSISISNTCLNAGWRRAVCSGSVIIARLTGVDGLAWDDLGPCLGRSGPTSVRARRGTGIKGKRGRGTSAASRCMNSSGDITRSDWRLPGSNGK